MKTIRISEDVWEEIAKRGKFGETVDDVLRKVFNIQVEKGNELRRKQRIASDRMSSRIADGHLVVSFYSGPNRRWQLPEKDDKQGIRQVREQAVRFAQDHRATIGQVNAVKKALTDAGYYVSR